MQPRRSRLQLDPPRDLTIPEAGSTTARVVLSRAMSRLIADLPSIGASLQLAPPSRADWASFLNLIRHLRTANPGALASVLRRPTVSTLVRCLRQGGSEDSLGELVALLHFELALGSALPAPARLLRAPSRLLSIPARLSVELPPDAGPVRFESGRLVIERKTGALEVDLEALLGGVDPTEETRVRVGRPYHVIDREIVLVLEDNNPLALLEAHPDKEGNAIELGGKTALEWTNRLREALRLIEEFMPDLRSEMDLYIQQIIPVGWYDVKHLSASYQENIGTIYMSLHPSLMTLAEALIHEFSHNKINALFELDELLENAWQPLYASPIRPDPRPLHGVLLAVHAFLPVARLYEKMIEAGHPFAIRDDFRERFANIKQINAEGAAVVLANGRPTSIGAGVLDEIRRWDEYYRGR